MSESKVKKEDSARYLLDTSAVMTLAEDEPGADLVCAILEKAKRGIVEVYICFISVMEACYKVHQYRGQEASLKMFNYLAYLPIKRVDVNNDLILTASSMKASYPVSLADAWILATAKYLNLCLVHKDPEFEQAKQVIAQSILPYKS